MLFLSHQSFNVSSCALFPFSGKLLREDRLSGAVRGMVGCLLHTTIEAHHREFSNYLKVSFKMSNAWDPEKNDFNALKGKVVVITGEIESDLNPRASTH